MNTLQNLHQHTVFCDGKDTPEEVVKAAIAKNFGAIGFSGHVYMHYEKDYSMSYTAQEQYKQEVARLKEAYRDHIEVYCGLEYDFCSDASQEGFDYLIGSIHGLKIDGRDIEVDHTAQRVRSVIDTYFGGDGLAYARAYYRDLATLPEYGRFDILGHFDLITKHKEKVTLFDDTSKEYRDAALEAAHALAGKIPFFEVNTGAIARGNRTSPYPDAFLIRELKNLGFGAVISSDCHDVRFIDCWFRQAQELLAACGFREKYILTKNGFQAVGIFE